MKSFFKFVIVAVIVLAILVAAIFLVVKIKGTGTVTVQKNEGGAIVASEVLENFEVCSLVYRYTNFVYSEDVMKFKDFEIPFTKAYFGVQYDGIMKIGVDGGKISVRQTEGRIVVRLPAAEILSHEQVLGSTEVLFDVDNVFNRNKIDEYVTLFDAEREKMEAKAREAGLLEEARASAEVQLADFLNAIPAVRDGYVIVFE